MKRNITSQLPGLARHIVSDDLSIVLDMRKEKTRYVGLICNIPFGYGYMLCPFVRKRISFDIPIGIFPKRFKSTNRGNIQ